MKTTLALAAAVFFSAAAGAFASTTHTITMSGGACTLKLTLSNDTSLGISLNSIAATYENDACGKLTGGGFVGSIPVAKGQVDRVITLSETGTPKNFILTLSFPLPGVGKQGTFGVWTSNGKTLSRVNSGNYTEAK